MTEPPPARRPIGFWLKLVDGLIDASFDEALGGDGVSRRHWQVLNLLADDGPSTRADLDAAVEPFLTAAEPSIEPVLADLRTRGWLDPGTGSLQLSADGRQAHARLRRSVSATRERVTAGLAAEQYEATVGVLRRMAENLGWPPD